jgi:DNA repair protein RadC
LRYKQLKNTLENKSIKNKNKMENLFQVSEVKLTYRTKQKASERPKINSSKTSYDLLLKCFDGDTIELKESFKVLLLNRANKVLGVMNVSDGGISGTIVDVRLIMQSVILSNATQIIMCHNHPSGNLIPSAQDGFVTSQVKKACDLMNIELLDHLIITPESYYSYADDGRL